MDNKVAAVFGYLVRQEQVLVGIRTGARADVARMEKFFVRPEVLQTSAVVAGKAQGAVFRVLNRDGTAGR